MKMLSRYIIITVIIIPVYSCSVIEKASIHGFESNYYTFRSDLEEKQKAFVDVGDEQTSLHNLSQISMLQYMQDGGMIIILLKPGKIHWSVIKTGLSTGDMILEFLQDLELL